MNWFDKSELQATLRNRLEIERFLRRQLEHLTGELYDVSVTTPIGYNHLQVDIDSVTRTRTAVEQLRELKDMYNVKDNVHLLEVALNLNGGHHADAFRYGFMPADIRYIYIVRECRDDYRRRKGN